MRRRRYRGGLPEPQLTRFHRVPPPASKGPDRRTPSKIRAAPFRATRPQGKETAMMTATLLGALFTSLFLGALLTGNSDNAS